MLDAVSTAQLTMNTDQLKLQSVSHNIANLNTSGYKKQFLDSLEPDKPVHYTHLATQGTLAQTQTPTDLAISGSGYFQVQNNQGIFYTRRGDFQLNKYGELSTATGETLLGAGGVIKPDNAAFTIDAQGTVFIDKQPIDQLEILRFENEQELFYIGNGLYQSNATPSPADHKTRVLQGFVEQSNVTSVDEMMSLLQISRHFEATQRIMRIADGLVSTAISQLGEGNV
ncbi:MAG: flagellar hook basal-body protein [Legionella sp.]|jgi:flagellar basal body rod protein FlgG